jgi:GAF domain-containing protein
MSCALADIVITSELKRRNHRTPHFANENGALHRLVRALPRPPIEILNELLQIANELCGSGTSGISLLETDSGGAQIFRWVALAGKLGNHVGGSTPRGHSPCGVTLDTGQPQLFSEPGRYFEYFQPVHPPIVEGLVLPIITHSGVALGTIWVVSHTKDVGFDSEDVRIMMSLSAVAAFACLRVMRERSGAENMGFLPDDGPRN